MHCPQCGNSITENQKFCGGCGFSLQSIAPPLVQQNPETLTREPEWTQVNTYSAPATPQQFGQPVYQQPSQPTYQEPYQKPKSKKRTGIVISVVILLVLLAGGFGVIQMGLIPGLSSLSLPGSEKQVAITNIRFATVASEPSTENTTFTSITSISALADLKNVKDVVEVEIMWLYEDEEILVDYIQYQAGDYIEYTIETADGGFFDLGVYRVIFYIDGIAVGNGSFEVL